MSTKFFTNETENTLLQKFEGIFQHRNIHFFDALIGYFRASGYFRIRPFIEKAQHIRILVGINVDTLIVEAQKNGLLFEVDVEKSQEDFFKKIRQNIQESEYSKVVEDGMTQLIADLSNGKVQIKVHPKQNIHAKIYIFREQEKHSHGYGAVITGSSNLTEAGLERNFEFNVELREDGDIEFATVTFEKLWAESILVSEKYVERLKKETFLNDSFTPYEVYLKFLIEYFGKSIDYDPEASGDLPKGFKSLKYQIDAMNEGFNKMMQHNGFFLADVVGLGKTIVATQIAKKFYHKSGGCRTLIIVPPALKENWEDTLDKFRFENYEIITNGSLHKVSRPEKYDLVIVDEAHKFRSDASDAYNALQKICKSPARKRNEDGSEQKKKVMLISATPLNNKPEDIANLVYLFQDSKDSPTLEIGNLQKFFREQINAYRDAKEISDLQEVKLQVTRIYTKIREKVIEPLTIRRTRTDLNLHEFYSIDLKNQGIRFPDIQRPHKILYQLEPHLEDLYDKTITLISGKFSQEYPLDFDYKTLTNVVKVGILEDKLIIIFRSLRCLTYNRYQAIAFLKGGSSIDIKKAQNISEQLTGLMKSLLVKRIDSSFFAFKQSLKRFHYANEAMISMYKKGSVFIGTSLPVIEMIQDGKEEELFDKVMAEIAEGSNARIYNADDFTPEFYIGLLNDKVIYEELIKEWDAIGDEDPKLDIFVDYLKNQLFGDINYEGKLVVFSESKETTEYLSKRLATHIAQRIITVDSGSRKDRMPAIKANFDANIAKELRKNDYDIVISTEVLAEGINLHRANIIVNYDTPWNSTRLMQRIGRVNRIGSEGDKVHIFNFFPTARVNSDIDLEKRALMKLYAFHAALGEDSQIYSEDEDVSTFGMFGKDLDDGERDERIDYLMEIRKIKENNYDLFKKIKNMPLRSRVGRKNKILKDGTITFIRNAKRDAFLYVKSDGTIEDLTFLETAKIYYCREIEKGIPLHSEHHTQVAKAIEHFEREVETQTIRKGKIDTSQGPNEKKSIAFLNGFLKLPNITEVEIQSVILAIESIEKGRFQNLQREINKLKKKQEEKKWKLAELTDELMKILVSYPLQKTEFHQDETPIILIPKSKIPDIIISESFNL